MVRRRLRVADTAPVAWLAADRARRVDARPRADRQRQDARLPLSLERLAAACERPPQRIGLSATQRPLDEVARFLGGVESRESKVKGRASRVDGRKSKVESRDEQAETEIADEFSVHRGPI